MHAALHRLRIYLAPASLRCRAVAPAAVIDSWSTHHNFKTSACLNAIAPGGREEDAITMSGMRFHAHHGVLHEEQQLGQKFDVDVTLFCGQRGLQGAGLSDDLAKTVSYADCYRDIESVMHGTRRELVEAVAEDIARQLLTKHTLAHSVSVRVTKPHVALPGHFDSMGVAIFRERSQ